MRILLVEDDEMLGSELVRNLGWHAHAVDWVRDGLAAGEHWRSTPYDLVLLDLGLPGRGGLQVLAEGRREGRSTPVLVVTARDAVQDRVEGLDAGADDYLLKPFSVDELLARIRALGRRKGGYAPAPLLHRGLAIDLAARTASFKGTAVSLTRREFALLTTLLEQPGRVWTREQLTERLYGWAEEIASNALDVHVHAIRRKLAADFVRNARGIGYFVPAEE